MRKLFLLFCWIATVLAAQARTWESLAAKIEVFDEQTITALAAVHDRIYCAAKTKLFIFNPKNNSMADVTDKVGKRGEDEVTALLVDPVRKEIWIVTNNNIHSAQCYNYELGKVQPESGSFLSRHAINDPIQIVTDQQCTIFSYFNIYRPSQYFAIVLKPSRGKRHILVRFIIL